MNILLIDNYDSFTYNIVELLRQAQQYDVSVVKNDAITISEAALYDKIILSPGPATPSEAGNMKAIIQALAPTHSILGICLGHQAIAEVFGARLRNLEKPFHGFRTTLQILNNHQIFKGLASSSIQIGLYHSWVVDEQNFPTCLEITSRSNEQHIMSLKHTTYDVHGIQFHPESYMTDFGLLMIENFLGTSDRV